MKAITDIRRENLQRWIDEKYNGVQAGFVAFTEINQGELSALLKNKSFGEKKARSIEEKAGMPIMWLDTPTQTTIHQSDNSGVTIGELSGTQNNVIGAQNNFFSESTGSLKNIAMPDNSFAPLIPHGSVLTYNTNDTTIKNGKIYLIQQGEQVFIRRAFPQLSGSVKWACENPAFGVDELPPDAVKIVGRVVKWSVED